MTQPLGGGRLNAERLLEDFMFDLTLEEVELSRSRFATLKSGGAGEPIAKAVRADLATGKYETEAAALR